MPKDRDEELKKDFEAIGRLSRFFGGGFETWYNMPVEVLNWFFEFMPIIDAEERLNFITDTACAMGALPKGEHRKHLKDLKRAAKVAAKMPPMPKELKFATLQAAGIAVEKVKKKEPGK